MATLERLDGQRKTARLSVPAEYTGRMRQEIGAVLEMWAAHVDEGARWFGEGRDHAGYIAREGARIVDVAPLAALIENVPEGEGVELEASPYNLWEVVQSGLLSVGDEVSGVVGKAASMGEPGGPGAFSALPILAAQLEWLSAESTRLEAEIDEADDWPYEVKERKAKLEAAEKGG